MNYIKVNAPKSADFFDFVFDFQKSKHGKNFGIRKIHEIKLSTKFTKIRHEDSRKMFRRKRNGKIFLTPWALNRKE